MQAHMPPHAPGAPPIPMAPHPAGLLPPGLPPSSSASLLSSFGGMAGLHPALHPTLKEEAGNKLI